MTVVLSTDSTRISGCCDGIKTDTIQMGVGLWMLNTTSACCSCNKSGAINFLSL